MRKKLTKIETGAAGRDDALDERVRRSRAKVLGVTAELLFERGFGGASVDEISRRSGVAKTTIYRHWPTRADLLLDACSTISTPQDVPDTGSFEGDVTALMTNLAHLLRSAKWTSVLPSIIDAAERARKMNREQIKTLNLREKTLSSGNANLGTASRVQARIGLARDR